MSVLPPEGCLKGLKVLVVDDNETARKSVCQQIVSTGMRPECATSGAQALEILRREGRKGEPFAVALVDLYMPEMNGIALVQSIRQDPDISGVHLVLMSAIGNRVDEEDLKTAHIDAFLSKPL